jgi:hypothetical protein
VSANGLCARIEPRYSSQQLVGKILSGTSLRIFVAQAGTPHPQPNAGHDPPHVYLRAGAVIAIYIASHLIDP